MSERVFERERQTEIVGDRERERQSLWLIERERVGVREKGRTSTTF